MSASASPDTLERGPIGPLPDELEGAVAGVPRRSRRVQLSRVTERLTLINFTIGAFAFVTAPLQARALGPTGRGELAAILLPFAFLPSLASIGVGSYAGRAVARGGDPAKAFGSLLPVTLLLGIVVAASAPILASFLAGGRSIVDSMLIVGLALFPIGMVTNLLIDISIGQEDWAPVMAYRLIPPILQLVGIPVLFFSGTLTVASASIVTFASSVLLLIPIIGVFRRCWPLIFDLQELKSGVSYGAKCWVGGLSNLANARLDQLLMIRMVPSAVLGVYAIAVNLATFFVTPVVGAVQTAATASLSRDATELGRSLCRMTLFGAAGVGLVVGALSPFVLHYLFGPGFDKALPMTLILIVAGVPNAGGAILNASVSSHGRPDLPAWGEGIALIVTVGGLIVALPTLGGVGAALVSAAAYSTQFTFLLFSARKVLGGRLRDYLIPTARDAQLVRHLVVTRMGSLVPRRLRTA